MTEKAKVLGVTGGVGVGKSTVLEYLKNTYGAEVILCDEVGKRLQEKGGACFRELAELLEPYGCLKNGELDRKRMAEVLFADEELLRKVNSIVHPAVMQEVERQIGAVPDEVPLVVIESALLIQAGYEKICDEIWFVYADRETRTLRLEESRGYSRQRILDMFAAQPGDDFFRGHAQLTIDNSSDQLQNTYGQIDRGLMEHGLLQHCQREQR